MDRLTLILAEREEFTLKGLQDLIRAAFTDADEDANGNNGEDYYVDGEPFCDYLDSCVEEWYNHGESEVTIVARAFDEYDDFCRNYYYEARFEYVTNDKKQITSLAFAGYIS